MDTRKSLNRRGMMFAFVVGTLLWSPLVFAQQQPQAADMLKNFKKGAALRSYDGTLYCIRCNVSPTPENLATCDKEGHEHFLLMKDGHVHNLYGITKEIADQINSKELHEKRVKIHGMYYPTSNAILVTSVQPAAQ